MLERRLKRNIRQLTYTLIKCFPHWIPFLNTKNSTARASPCNTAEGNGKRQGRHRAKFFNDARGSALECAACLDAAVAKGLISADRVCPGKQMLARVVAMLSRLIDRFDT
jgi:four helix bundle protein